MKNNFETVENIKLFLQYLYDSAEWNNLKDKTQVFNERKTTAVKSRGSHSSDVGRIASDLAQGLSPDDQLAVAKAELIGVIHDLGHITYGHAGESVANSIITSHEYTAEETKALNELRRNVFGEKYFAENPEPCFEHNENSALEYVRLCQQFGFEPSPEIIQGILSHSTSRVAELPPTISQQAVRLADKLAYINYDVQDLLLSFQELDDETKALNTIYSRPLLDPQGNEIKITIAGKEYSIIEFLNNFSAEERIELFVSEAVRDAKEHKNERYPDYSIALTGCNDIVVKMADLKKKIKKASTDSEKATLQKQMDDLNAELYQRSPILYMAYEIKNRSDEFIRSGNGLEKGSKEDRIKNATSAVGNKDLLNEYVFKQFVTAIEKLIANPNLQCDPRLRALFNEYEAYAKNYDSAFINSSNEPITNIPEINKIVAFIGLHSNSELTALAEELGLIENFNQEVLPKLNELINNPQFYDADKAQLTEAGITERAKIISEYGAVIKLNLGLEEENIMPLANEETINMMRQEGYEVEGNFPKELDLTNEELNQHKNNLYDQEKENNINEGYNSLLDSQQIMDHLDKANLEDVKQLLDHFNGSPIIIDGKSYYPSNDPISATKLNSRYHELSGQDHPVYIEQVPKIIDNIAKDKDQLIDAGSFKAEYFDNLQAIKNSIIGQNQANKTAFDKARENQRNEDKINRNEQIANRLNTLTPEQILQQIAKDPDTDIPEGGMTI